MLLVCLSVILSNCFLSARRAFLKHCASSIRFNLKARTTSFRIFNGDTHSPTTATIAAAEQAAKKSAAGANGKRANFPNLTFHLPSIRRPRSVPFRSPRSGAYSGARGNRHAKLRTQLRNMLPERGSERAGAAGRRKLSVDFLFKQMNDTASASLGVK